MFCVIIHLSNMFSSKEVRMISLLHIKNIGIIDDLSIDLKEGFNVLTGETGAGKTLIIGALKILSGGRFSKEMIRTGQKNSFVEISLSLPEYEDNVIVSREINQSGKNTCKINGRLVTVNELRDFMKNVIDIHGQNDNQSILDLNKHIELLDGYANQEIQKTKIKYVELYQEFTKIKKELSLNYGDDFEKQRKLDLLNYQLNEIEVANLKQNEEEELEEKRKLILASEKISVNLKEAKEEIENNSIDSLNHAIRALEKIEQYNQSYVELVIRLKNSYYEIQEVGRDLSCDDIDFNQEEQNQIEERLELIHSLKRKYGNSIEEILEYKEKVEKEISEITNLETYLAKLKEKLAKLKAEMLDLANKMNQVRQKYANQLSNEITKQLKDLEMQNAKLQVNVEWLENNDFNSNGLNRVEFLISTNQGDEAKSLIKIASGGEMSRVMLAIKTVLADIDQTPILVFDEIDTGISGVAANSTGEKMKKIAKNHQVICVTHLATIAAKGDYNYYIFKTNEENTTKTHIHQLDEEQTIREIARISNGEITQMAIQNAKEMREMSKKIA